MPPIYGEGAERAFLRLQEEILKRNPDQTIFLWTPAHEPYNQGLLATSPRAFCTHPGCFDWLFPFDEGFERIISYRDLFGPLFEHHTSQIYAGEGAITSLEARDDLRNSQDTAPSFGPYGLQISLPTRHENGPDQETGGRRALLLVSLDVKPYFWANGVRVCLRLVPDIDSDQRFTPDRFGSLRREVCTRTDSRQIIESLDSPFYRTRVTVSQISPPEQGQPSMFRLIAPEFSGYLHRTKSNGLISSPDGYSVIDLGLTDEFFCNGGCVILGHECPLSSFEDVLLLAFGTKDRYSEPWCALRSILAGEISESSLEDYHVLFERLKGRFRDRFALELKCGHFARVGIDESRVLQKCFEIYLN